MKKYRLGEIAEVIGGVTFNKADITTSGIRILRGGNIQNGEICLKEDDVYLPHIYKDNKNTILEGDTILVASTGSVEVLGKAATAFSSLGEVQIGAFLRIIRPKKTRYAALISAHLQSSQFREYIQKQAKGTSINNIRNEYLINFLLYVPNEDSLVDFSAFYHTIQRKIALNRAINHNLEAMAKQLYDYWFVQFDFPDAEGKPYKSSGGKMVYNDKLKREIPEGWECGSLLDIATFTNGLACQKHRPSNIDHSLPIIKIREMRTGTDNDSERVSSEIPESVKVYNGDILFSWSASLEVMLWAGGNGGLNQHIFKVTSANEFPKSFYFYQVLNYVSVFKQMAEARKTTMGHITQEHLMQSVIAIPKNKSITALFEDKLEPIFNQIIVKQESIQNLIKLRNELLPLLINGQVSVGAVNYDLSKHSSRAQSCGLLPLLR